MLFLFGGHQFDSYNVTVCSDPLHYFKITFKSLVKMSLMKTEVLEPPVHTTQ